MRKKRYRILWHRVIIAVILLILIITSSIKITSHFSVKRTKYEQKLIVSINEQQEEIKNEVLQINNTIYTPYRLTSYYTGDPTGSGEWVGAGMHTSQFEINENGWYTYKDKLVLAGATNECLKSKHGPCKKWNEKKSDKHYFNYFDELIVIIDGTSYEAVILDSCGACMDLDENRIDLFVSNKESVIDRGYKGINEIEVSYEIRK